MIIYFFRSHLQNLNFQSVLLFLYIRNACNDYYREEELINLKKSIVNIYIYVYSNTACKVKNNRIDFSTFGRDTSPKKGKRILRTLEEEKVYVILQIIHIISYVSADFERNLENFPRLSMNF